MTLKQKTSMIKDGNLGIGITRWIVAIIKGYFVYYQNTLILEIINEWVLLELQLGIPHLEIC